MFEEIEQKLRDGAEISMAEVEALRAHRDRLDDIQDQVDGQRLGVSSTDFALRSRSSAGFAIVVGHTLNRPGAMAAAPISQAEYTWNKDLAGKIKALCDVKAIESRIFYRDGIGISGAYRQVADWGAAMVVELHFNAFNTQAHGTETLYDNDRNAESKAWAQRLQDGMLAALSLRDRGLKERDPGDRGYSSVSAIDIPSALIEPFFGDNPTEAHVAEAKKDDLAEAVAEAAAVQLTGV